MFDSIILFFGVAVFIAVVLGLEGSFLWWSDRRGPEAKRMQRRLRLASAGGLEAKELSIVKQRVLSHSEGIHRLLLAIPRVHSLDRIIVQSGLSMTVGDLISLSVMLAAAGLIGPILLGYGLLLGIILGCILGSLPMLHVINSRKKRLTKLDGQLPDALDLMARALRAGHAFPTAINMVGDEMSEPIAGEFRVLSDEINYGIRMQDALLDLLSRIPSTDLQYFVAAVLIQRETGGNLAELLENISSIVRSRMKLMGEVRTLSAEGRLSAWILTILPFAVALLLNILNPEFMAVLWSDPLGIKMIYGAIAMMAFGIWWMRKIIRIRV